ncbi:hypothetical protein [Kitasatospora sp. NPDC059327]|uniref:hypothetical protein n=1 Tax=Kitasatospora sp. NPDC059327 TaxID=3346803 RepID=UPI0036BD066D
MSELEYACDITGDDVRSAVAFVSRQTPSEEPGSRSADLAAALVRIADSLGRRLDVGTHLAALGELDHGGLYQLKEEWNELMCCVEPWKGRDGFDEERFRTVRHLSESSAAVRSYALSQARKFAEQT